MIYIRVVEKDAMVNDMLYAAQNIKIRRLPSQILCLANLKFRNLEFSQFSQCKIGQISNFANYMYISVIYFHRFQF